MSGTKAHRIQWDLHLSGIVVCFTAKHLGPNPIPFFISDVAVAMGCALHSVMVVGHHGGLLKLRKNLFPYICSSSDAVPN